MNAVRSLEESLRNQDAIKSESDGCIDTWIEVMKLNFEEEDLSQRQ